MDANLAEMTAPPSLRKSKNVLIEYGFSGFTHRFFLGAKSWLAYSVNASVKYILQETRWLLLGGNVLHVSSANVRTFHYKAWDFNINKFIFCASISNLNSHRKLLQLQKRRSCLTLVFNLLTRVKRNKSWVCSRNRCFTIWLLMAEKRVVVLEKSEEKKNRETKTFEKWKSFGHAHGI